MLGAGNIAAITLLDTLQKLLVENQVVLLKLFVAATCYRSSKLPSNR